MNQWEHLLQGEYAERSRILSGLTLEQVSAVPAEQGHSIFAELWHTALWQKIVLRDQPWEEGDLHPAHGPEKLEEWTDLVTEFLSGLETALDLTRSPERLNLTVEPGVTMSDALRGLAVHNAYHMGKIVALRQLMGVWTTES